MRSLFIDLFLVAFLDFLKCYFVTIFTGSKKSRVQNQALNSLEWFEWYRNMHTYGTVSELCVCCCMCSIKIIFEWRAEYQEHHNVGVNTKTFFVFFLFLFMTIVWRNHAIGTNLRATPKLFFTFSNFCTSRIVLFGVQVSGFFSGYQPYHKKFKFIQMFFCHEQQK